MLEQNGVAILGHALIRRLREVAVVIADEHGHAAGHRRIYLVGRLAPLLHRVIEEDVLVDIIRDLLKVRIVLLTELHDGDLLVLTEGINELTIQLFATIFAERELEARVVERNGHKGTVDVGEHLVLVIRPLGKAREELVHALAVGVVDVRTVLVDEDALVVHVVVGVARDVLAALEHRDAKSSALRHTARAYRAGVPGTHHDHVVRIGVEGCRKTVRDLHTCSLQGFSDCDRLPIRQLSKRL